MDKRPVDSYQDKVCGSWEEFKKAIAPCFDEGHGGYRHAVTNKFKSRVCYVCQCRYLLNLIVESSAKIAGTIGTTEDAHDTSGETGATG